MFKGLKKFLRRVVLLAVVIAGGYGGYEAYDLYAAEYSPTITITADWGGVLDDYITKYDRWRVRGRYVRLDSFCVSACTMAIGRIPADHLCATPTAILGFHSASERRLFESSHSVEGTKIIWHVYPQPLRGLLRERGWDGDDIVKGEHPGLLYVEGDDVYKFVRPCV